MAGGSRSTWLIPFEVGLAMVCGCWFATGGVVRGWLSASPRLFADRVSSHRCNGRDRRATAVPAATLEGWPNWGNAHADNAFCFGGVGERFCRWNRLVGPRTIGYRWFRRCEDNQAPRTLMRYRSTTFGAIAHSLRHQYGGRCPANEAKARFRNSNHHHSSRCPVVDGGTGSCAFARENAPAGGECFRCLPASTSAKEPS